MARLFQQVIRKELADNTYESLNLSSDRRKRIRTKGEVRGA